MSLSKPAIALTASYLQNLYLYPIRTKSLTSCVLSATANVLSQLISGEKKLNVDSVLAFAAFGLFFGGTLPHYFYQLLGRILPPNEVRYRIVKQLLIERLIYTPLFQAFAQYAISRFEGRNHVAAVNHMQRLLKTMVLANWKWLTIFHIINLTAIPPALQVLFVNLVGFFWVMFVAKMRRSKASVESKRPPPRSS